MSFPTPSDGSLNWVFEKYPIKDFDAPKAIVIIDSDVSVAQASKILSDNNVLSAPVRDVTAAPDAVWTDKYIGVVDFPGMIQWMMEHTWGLAPVNHKALLELRESFMTTPVSRLLEHNPASRFVALDSSDDSLLDAMLLLGKYGLHRTWVVKSPGGDIVNVVTQSGVLALLKANLDVIQPIASQSLTALGLAAPIRVVAVRPLDSYWYAFRLMKEKGVSAVPVLDEHGKIVDNISSHDLREMILDESKFLLLCSSVGDKHHRIHPAHLYTCKATDTLHDVILKLAATHIHRVYVVDSAGKPIGVVALREVLARCVLEPKDSQLWKFFIDQ